MIGRMKSGHLEMQQELYSVCMVRQGRGVREVGVRRAQQEATDNESIDVQVVQQENHRRQQARGENRGAQRIGSAGRPVLG